jgi:hypothetical protein
MGEATAHGTKDASILSVGHQIQKPEQIPATEPTPDVALHLNPRVCVGGTLYALKSEFPFWPQEWRDTTPVSPVRATVKRLFRMHLDCGPFNSDEGACVPADVLLSGLLADNRQFGSYHSITDG